MDLLRVLKVWCVGLSCLGMILPASLLEAAPAAAAKTSRQPAGHRAEMVSDLELDASGRLHGLVVNVEGVPVGHAVVSVRQMNAEVASTKSDALGRFSIGQLRGGTYQLTVGNQGRLVRAWAANTAPPAAKGFVLIIVGGDVIRGQMPLEEFFASDAVVVVGLVAAMIAIPIVVNNSHDSAPSSP